MKRLMCTIFSGLYLTWILIFLIDRYVDFSAPLFLCFSLLRLGAALNGALLGEDAQAATGQSVKPSVMH